MPRIDLLTVGEAFQDLIFAGLPHMPKPGEEMKTALFAATIGGGAVITATAASRLGLRTAIVSALSRDAARARRGHDRGRRRIQRRLPGGMARRTAAPRVPATGQPRRRAVDAGRRRRRCPAHVIGPTRSTDLAYHPDPTYQPYPTYSTYPTHQTYPTYPPYRSYPTTRAQPTHPPCMKIAVIGGAGVRTPLLVGGLTQSDLPIDQIALYDTDETRLATIGAVADRMAGGVRVTRCVSVAECVARADFVFTSIRVGGIERRIHDEAAAQRHGIVGQETVGPAGFAMATRTIPHMVRYAQVIAEAAPRAWIINFTNPVGMVTEAMRTATDRVVGICDTPTELFEDVAHALGLESARCEFDYFGLNHLGWLREVYSDGLPQLHRLWNDADALRSIYRVPLFDSASLRRTKLLPTEYVYYYDQPTRAFDNVRRAGRSRGQDIAELTRALFDCLNAPGADSVACYKSYLRTRSASYMQIECGNDGLTAPPPAAGLSGYDRIALGVVRAIHFNANAVIPLSVPNRGTIADLPDADIVEVPCVVNANGARPLHVGRVPDAVAPLLARVKEYERLTVRATLAQSLEAACEALALNPLVPDRATADRLVADLSPLW